MTRKTTTALTTACISMAVGTAAYMMTGNRSSKVNTKRIKKSTGKALRQVGDFIDNISYMMR